MRKPNSKGKIFSQSLLYSFPAITYSLFTFFSDVWYWVRVVYFPGPYRSKISLDEAIHNFYWPSHLRTFVFALALFFLVFLVLTLANKKKEVSITISYFYMFPSVYLVYAIFKDTLKTSPSDSMSLIYLPFVIVILIVVTFFNWILLKSLQKRVRKYLKV